MIEQEESASWRRDFHIRFREKPKGEIPLGDPTGAHELIEVMRNRIEFLTFILIVTSNFCFGQKTEVEFLLRPSLASLRGNQAVKNNLDPTINLTYGLSANFNIKQNKFIQTTLLYEDKSIKGSITSQSMQGAETIELVSNFKCLTLPIQWGYRLGKKIKYHFGVGLYTSYLIKAESSQKSTSFSVIDDQTDLFKHFDFGLSTSFKAYLPLSEKINALIGIDDNLGLINASSVPVADGETIKHNSFGVIIGLNLRLN